MVMLSKYFSYNEFVNTSHEQFKEANRLAFTDEYVENAKFLCESLLDIVREHCDKPIYITSGFRCNALNSWICAKHNSQHLLGQAADIHMKDTSINGLFNTISVLDLIPAYNQLVNIGLTPTREEMYRDWETDRKSVV